MATPSSRPVLRLKGHELVPPDEDRRVEVGVYEILLPCRKYEVAYKVAVLGQVSPSLEFLLRLVKSVPGISADDCAMFFGYSRGELAYVLDEALGPGYLERKSGKLWLTSAGDSLFRDGEKEPSIFSVEGRNRSIGFDFLSIAPQQPKSLDLLELSLPELPIEDAAGTGKVVERIPDRFRHFFRELAERRDREQLHRRDLYSIDRVTAGDRFQMPVRIRAYAQASNPATAEIDLSSWRPDHELADRQQIESSAGLFLEDMKTTANQLDASAAYQNLVDFAPEFLKEFTTRAGLSVNRYWREAVSRVGEPRVDRKTIAIVGSSCLQENIERFLAVLDYGVRDKQESPERIVSVAPQIKNWAATTLQRDALSLIRKKIGQSIPATDQTDVKAVCLFAGKPPRHIERTFDEVRSSDTAEFSPALEIMLVPRMAVLVTVHAPIGATTGYPVPLGFASFDSEVLERVGTYIEDRIARYRGAR